MGLVTLAEVRATCSHIPADVEDAVLTRLINAVSEKIRNFTKREWVCPREVATTRVYPMFGDKTVFPEGLVSIASIKDEYGVTLATSAYSVMNGKRTTDHIQWIDFSSNYDFVTITGSWGWTEIPADVKEAVFIAIEGFYMTQNALYPQGMMDISSGVNMVFPKERLLPPKAYDLLVPWVFRTL